MMNKKSVLEFVSEMPENVKTDNNKSWDELCVLARKYVSDFNVYVEDLSEFLSINQKYINYWIQYSDDKRTSGGYGLDPDDGVLKIKHYNINGDIVVLKASRNFAEICAEYIFMECGFVKIFRGHN